MKILWLDDSQIVLNQAKVLIKASFGDKLSLSLVQDETTIFSEIASFKPSLIFLDYILPTTTGGEIIKKLHQRKIFTPVVVVSSYPLVFQEIGKINKELAKSSKPEVVVLEKPFTKELIKNIIDIFMITL